MKAYNLTNKEINFNQKGQKNAGDIKDQGNSQGLRLKWEQRNWENAKLGDTLAKTKHV